MTTTSDDEPPTTSDDEPPTTSDDEPPTTSDDAIPEPPLDLAMTPTPLETLDSVGDEVDVLVKRDDLSGGVVQGNKLRKLAYELGPAVAGDADTVVTCGGVQSNHCRTTALVARRLGLDPYLLLLGDDPDVFDGNHLLQRMAGAEVEFVSEEAYYERRAETFREVEARLEADGRTPYLVPAGGTTGRGVLGYVRAYAELRRQAGDVAVDADTLYLPAGSGGTYAGLLLGARHFGDDVDLVGLNTTPYTCERIRGNVRENVADALEHAPDLDVDPADLDGIVDIRGGYEGPAYAEPTSADVETILRVARREGVVLDPTYTGKAFRGMLDLLESGETAVFVHTGGTYGLFPQRERFTEAIRNRASASPDREDGG